MSRDGHGSGAGRRTAPSESSVPTASRLQRGLTAAALAPPVGVLAAWAVAYAGLLAGGVAAVLVGSAAFAAVYTRDTWSSAVGSAFLLAAGVVALAPVGRFVAAGLRWPPSTWLRLPGTAGTALWLAGFGLVAGAAGTVGLLLALYRPRAD